MPYHFRKQCVVAAAAIGLFLLAAASHAQAPGKTLRVVPHADLKVLDPLVSSAYITRNFAHMVYDTLFGLDTAGKPQPQMIDTWSKSADGLKWTFTLRPGLRFSDGSDVTASDAVASLKRWAARDAFGIEMTRVASAEWAEVDSRTFVLQLKAPFGAVLDGLSKASVFPPFVMPRRLAILPPAAGNREVVGSGPYVFKRDEWAPGNKVVFVRNPYYVGRQEPANGFSGNRRGAIDRVEWIYIPDSFTAVAALRAGEVDMIESVELDQLPGLRSQPGIRLVAAGETQAVIVMNHLHPPFNDPRVRQALLQAVDQREFMMAVGVPPDRRMARCRSYFICGTPNETSAGTGRWGEPDIQKARKMLADAGYRGEKVVVLAPSDLREVNALAQMTAKTLRSIGMEVELQTADWGSLVARRSRKEAPSAGGWNINVTFVGAFDSGSPINNVVLAAACGNNYSGWPCDPQLDALRLKWLQAGTPESRKFALDAFHARAMESVPYVSAGQFSRVSALGRSVQGGEKLYGGVPMAWVLDK
ncbi:MAG: ABC transporter substrate-binding protein [Comamonadaceae bacterium]|nr:MAG: ABC transporter substrate-binding protein [Comamonadaceae bacterium]